jgi:hypothetical protein
LRHLVQETCVAAAGLAFLLAASPLPAAASADARKDVSNPLPRIARLMEVAAARLVAADTGEWTASEREEVRISLDRQRDAASALHALVAEVEAQRRRDPCCRTGAPPLDGGPTPLERIRALLTMQEELRAEASDLALAIELAEGGPTPIQQALLRRLAAREGNLAGALESLNRELTRL